MKNKHTGVNIFGRKFDSIGNRVISGKRKIELSEGVIRPVMQKIFFAVMLAATFFVSGCSHKYSKMNWDYEPCGYGKVRFDEFAKCMKARHPLPDETPSARNTSDNFTKANAKKDPILTYFHTEVTTLEQPFQTKMSKKETAKANTYAYQRFDQVVGECVAKEARANQIGQAIGAAMLVGAAVAVCANGNCGNLGGNNSSYAGYDGNCPCPYSLDAAGNQCGARSAYSRTGGASPACY